MKKFLLLPAVAMLMLASCGDNNGGTNSVSLTIPTYNLVSSMSGAFQPYAVASYYRYNFDLTTQTTSLTTELEAAAGPKISWAASSLPYKSAIYDFGTEYSEDNIYSEVITVSAMSAASSTAGNITALTSEVTSTAFIPPYTDLAGVPALSIPANFRYLIMSYYVGSDIMVRTFWNDVTFKGTTTVAENSDLTDNRDISYRIVLNVKENKASVILYNVKFSENSEMMTNLMLADLPLKFTTYGYEISATNVVPVSYVNGASTQKPELKFDHFDLIVTGDMVNSSIDYSVGGTYNCTFDGYCMLPLQLSE